MDNLATKYWHRIRELESALNKALKHIDELEKGVGRLRKENLELKVENAQLKEMLFGRGKNGRGGKGLKMPKLYEEKKENPPRGAATYRRAEPQKVDQVKSYSLEKCQECDGKLKFLEIMIRYHSCPVKI